jgi:hypothetical protein
MSVNNLKVELEPREDREKNIFYLGKIQFPGRIDLYNGVTFLIFISEDGEEELQIAKNNKENATFSKYTKRNDRLKVEIESRKDQYGKIFYVAKLQYSGYIDCSAEVVFLVFVSKGGFEELQIVGSVRTEDRGVKRSVDVYNKRLGTVSVG